MLSSCANYSGILFDDDDDDDDGHIQAKKMILFISFLEKLISS